MLRRVSELRLLLQLFFIQSTEWGWLLMADACKGLRRVLKATLIVAAAISGLKWVACTSAELR
jgi:hypothetical protein